MGKGITLTFCDIEFLSFGHILANFYAYIAVWSKVMNILSHLPGSFQYFQFLLKGFNIKLQQFVTIFCWNIYHQTCRCLFCLCKKCNPVFNPWVSLLFNPSLSQGICLHHLNLERLKVCCVQTLLRQYAPCKHNRIDDFAKQSDEQIIVFHNINIL